MKTAIAKLFIVIGLFGATVLIANLHSLHQVVFNKPSGKAADIPELRNFFSKHTDSWRVVHILAGSCRCSQYLIDYLEHRQRLPSVHEIVLLIDPKQRQIDQIEKAGFEHITLTSADLVKANYELTGLPLLLVANATGQIVYTGGYTVNGRINAASAFEDINTIKSLQQGVQVDEQLIRGCAVSQSLAAMLDPMNLKQTRVSARQ